MEILEATVKETNPNQVPMRRARHRTIRNVAGNKWGWHSEARSVATVSAASGVGRIFYAAITEAIADLQSECPFGAERSTERTALRQPIVGILLALR